MARPSAVAVQWDVKHKKKNKSEQSLRTFFLKPLMYSRQKDDIMRRSLRGWTPLYHHRSPRVLLLLDAT